MQPAVSTASDETVDPVNEQEPPTVVVAETKNQDSVTQFALSLLADDIEAQPDLNQHDEETVCDFLHNLVAYSVLI